MPQLVPFYFLNQLFIAFIVIGSLLSLFSIVILPYYLELKVIRLFVKSL